MVNIQFLNLKHTFYNLYIRIFFFLASVPLLVSPVGLIVIGILTDKIGRRKALQVAYIPNVLSWLVLANAHTLNAIIIGRIILGTTFGKSK